MPSSAESSSLTPSSLKQNGGKRRKYSSKRGKRGGISAWQSVYNAVGSLKPFSTSIGGQWGNTFGPKAYALHGNEITHRNGAPNMSQSDITRNMKGGSRRKRSKRGGYWGNVIGQALVPFGLLGAQQTYGKRKQYSSARKTHKRRRH